MRLIMVILLSSPMAFGKQVDIHCNVISECRAEWENSVKNTPPQFKLACQGQPVQAKVSRTQEAKWQKVSFDF